MYKKYIKRLLDVVFSLVLMPLIIPVIALCGLFIKIEDKGPVFYLGERLGQDKKTFKMYKLRSMKVNAPDVRNDDGSTFNSDSDPRLTNIGKFIRKTSLDELPQIINVLLGDMSFIGPRPDLPEAINLYSDDEVHKLDARPGITGYNQAYYRNSVNQKERFKNDIYYVNNISLKLDFKILFSTVVNVIKRKNINIESNIYSKK
ncbi:sugar transferase [Metabacillus litoralis]|uniref:sugar transferase n=1 Tax=Metabacillus litoralis TaxID=152268 RepID=UPI00203ADB18|nr:sugar transferase [Metabacillus litoralis]MCM3163757.1 sugar transferase [Metabacillus litoralis]